VRTAFRRYRALFGTPGVARVAVPSVIGRLPIGMYTLLFVLVVAEGTGSYTAAGLATAANSAATAVVSPLLGRIADRGRAASVLAICGVGEAALLVAMVFALRADAPVPVVIGIAGLAGALSPPIGAVTRVVLPRLAPDPASVQTAYALDAIAVELTYVAGPAVVGVVTAVSGAYVATIVAASITAVGTLALATAPAVRTAYADRPPPVRPSATRRRSPLFARGMVVVLFVAFVQAAAYGVMEVAIPAHAEHLGHASAAGLLMAVWSIGSIAGGLWYSGLTLRTPPHIQYGVLMLLNVAGFAAILLGTNLLTLGGLLLFAGLFIAPLTAVEFLLVTALAPEGTETEAFTWANTAVYLGFAAGSALAGTALGAVLGRDGGLRTSGLVAVGLVGLGAVVAITMRNRLRAPVRATVD
jgi:MFS family permease